MDVSSSDGMDFIEEIKGKVEVRSKKKDKKGILHFYLSSIELVTFKHLLKYIAIICILKLIKTTL